MFKDEKCPFSKNHYFKTTLLRQRMSRRLSGRERAGSTLPFQDHQNSVAERLPSVRDPTASDVIQPRMTRFGRSPIMAGICPPTRTAGSRPIPGQNGRIPAVWPGFGSSPTKSLVGVEVESEIVWGAGFPVGRGAGFPVVGVGIVVGRRAKFPVIRWFRQVGFKRR
jgi:hypothetical protein